MIKTPHLLLHHKQTYHALEHARYPQRIELCIPSTAVGTKLHDLVASCPPLDRNSVYCNLLQCSHFASTSVVAQRGHELLGSVTGYLIPESPDTIFVWQVAVAEKARGNGLARRMIMHILQRESCAHVRFLETTVTADNKASENMFAGVAHQLDAAHRRSVQFDRDRHFGGEHATEYLLRIGPFEVNQTAREERKQ